MRKKLLSMLALLLMAVMGAKAQSGDASMLETPLTFEAITGGSIYIIRPQGQKYTVNGGDKQTAPTNGNNYAIAVNAGDIVQFYGSGTSIQSYEKKGFWLSDETEVYVYGNVMSLIDEENFSTNTTLTAERCFWQLFYYISNRPNKIYNHPTKKLLLPATTLTTQCYYEMFRECPKLTTAPELPATTLADLCYSLMFYNCTSLTTGPSELPATTLTTRCYEGMFLKCSSLTTAPALPATTLASACYNTMFCECTSLTTAPELPATTLAKECYKGMFYKCYSLTTAPVLPAPTMVSGCYSGMFEECSSLTALTCLATSGFNANSGGQTYRWLAGVASPGTFTMHKDAGIYNAIKPGWGLNSQSGIPNGWTYTTYVAPAATATTAPTATEGSIYKGDATPLFSAGTASGGTMQYQMTKENTTPTSTDGFGTTIPTAENQAPGTYYVWYYIKADDSHSDSEIFGPITITVLGPQPTITTAPTATAGDIYGGASTPLVSAGTATGGTMKYKLTDSSTAPTTTEGFGTDVPTAAGITKPGTYYVWYYVDGDDDHSDSEIKGPITITILGPKPTVTTAPTATAGTIYTGKPTALVSAGAATGGTMKYKLTNSSTAPTTTEGFGTNVPTAADITTPGTYYVWYYVDGDDDHSDSEILGPIEITVQALTAASVTTAPTATSGDIYTTKTTPLVSAGTPSGGTMMYTLTTENTAPTSVVGTGFSADVPTAEDLTPGTYYVWYYVEGDDSHGNSAIGGPITITVLALPDATVATLPTATTDIYAGETTALFSAGTATGGTMKYKLADNNTKPTTTEGFDTTIPTAENLTPGTYYVWYYIDGDADHSDSAIDGPITITIKNPRATTATAPTATADLCSGDATDVISAGTATGGTMNYMLTDDDTKPTTTDGFGTTIPTAENLAPGTYYVWYYIAGDGDHSDSEILGPIAITIKNPRATTATAPTATEDDVYAGKTTALVNAGTATGGTMMYTVTNENTKPATTDGFGTDVPTAENLTAPGTYYIWYYIKGDDTHSDSEIFGPIEVTVISKKELTNSDITIHVDDVAYTGKPQTPKVIVKDGETTLKEGTDFSVSYANNINPGTATVTVTAMGSYYSGEITATFEILDGSIDLTINGYYGEYDGQPHGITIEAPEEATVKFSETGDVYDLDASPTFVSAGVYTVYYQVTETNYSTVNGKASVIIDKAPATFSFATTTGFAKTFGDEAFTNELTLTGDGTVRYSTSDAEVATVDAETGEVTIIGAGTATITATAIDGVNYSYDPNTVSYEVTVGYATMTVTSSGWTGTYDGQPHSITVNAPKDARIKYGRAEDGCHLVRIPTYTNTGTYTCYYEVTMDNYTKVTGHETVTIKKAEGAISYAVTSIKKSKGAEAFTNPLTNTGDGVVSYATTNSRIARVNVETGEVIVGKKEGTVTITATVKDGPNYDYAEKTATYTLTVGETTEPGGDEPGGDDAIVINTNANEANGDHDAVDGVKFVVSVNHTLQTKQEERTFVDPVTGETITKTVTVVPVALESIIIPQQKDASATKKQEIVVAVPAFVVSNDGETIYEVTSIKDGAFISNEPTAIVVGIILPDTSEPLEIKKGALAVDKLSADNPAHRVANVQTPLHLLDNYAMLKELKEILEEGKLMAPVEAQHRLRSFSCGIDVELTGDAKVYIAKKKSASEVGITELTGKDAQLDNGMNGIKANNGVIIAFKEEPTDRINVINAIASPTQANLAKIGTKPTTDNARSYAGNELIPVIVEKHFKAGEICVLSKNEFHPILNDEDGVVSACKAVLKNTGSANARLVITVANGTTGIDASLVNSEERIVKSDVYDLNGRQVQNPVKGGVYIINNKKVVIK